MDYRRVGRTRLVRNSGRPAALARDSGVYSAGEYCPRAKHDLLPAGVHPPGRERIHTPGKPGHNSIRQRGCGRLTRVEHCESCRRWVWGVGGVGWQDEIYGSSLRIVIRGALAPLSPVAFMPAVTSTPSLTSTASATADTYGVGETIRFTVTFSEAVEVTGAPGFGFSLGNRGQTDGTDRRAATTRS